MRVALLFSMLALAGCSTVSSMRDAWTWDLAVPPARAVLTAEESARLTNEAAALQIERNEIRARISAEADIWRRQGLYAQLHDVGMRLSPLERQLQAAAPAR